ncbi:MAG: HipA domain-containing protein [Bacteroidota bacterium]
MKRCPISYSPVDNNPYSSAGLKLLSSGLSGLKELEYTAEEQRNEAYYRASIMSIQGVQPKLSAILSFKHEKFEIVDTGGRYILKPQHPHFPQLPENEDLTMRLAEMVGLEIPLHGMIWSKDGSLTYFIKRFDRKGQNDKIPVEDFAQLAGLNRDTKYDYSMEKVVKIIDKYCTFPIIEKVKLFKLVLFNFIIGNDDMHLKNFSIINREGKIQLSPSYDLINTTIEFKKPDEEIALPLKGKKRKLTKKIIVDYFAREKCELTKKVISNVLDSMYNAIPGWKEVIKISFLSDEMKEKYLDLINERLKKIE